MRAVEEIEEMIQAMDDVIRFASLIELDTSSVSNLKAFKQILEWVLTDAN